MILITGATGNFGSAAVAAAQRVGVPFRAMAHTEEKAAPLRAQGVSVVTAEMGNASALDVAFRDVTGLFLISPSSPALVELEAGMLRAAKRAKVERVVKISAFSVGTPFQAGLGNLHAAAEAALRDSGLEWTALRAAATMGTPLRVGLRQDDAILAPCGNEVAAYCAPVDVCEVAIRILERGGHGGRAHSITGPEAIDLSTVAAIVSKVIGRPLRYVAIPESEYESRALAAGVPKSAVDLALSLFKRIRAGEFHAVTATVRDVLGREATSYAAWAAENARMLA